VAGIIIPGVPQQIRLIARLRWLLFKNSLRNIKGRLEAVSTGILWLMMGGLVFGGGIFFGIAAYWLVRRGHWQWLAGLLWIVFAFWQLYPIFAASVGAQFDFANLLRFPLRFGSFFILSLVYGLFDPGAVASLVWLFAMWIGLVLARPALFLWGFVVLFAFAALNLFFARMLFAWIEKWLARRRTREILGFIFILIIISFQLIGPAVRHFQHQHANLRNGWILALVPVANALPAGVAGRSLQFSLEGTFIPAAYSFLFVLLYAAAFLWLFRVRLAAQFRGENLSETSAALPAPARAARPAPSQSSASPAAAKPAGPSLQIPGVSRATSAIFEKELRYALRSGPMLLSLLVPVLLVVIFGFTSRQQTHDKFLAHAPQMVFPIAIAYTFLIQMNWVFNSFAFEGSGIQFLLLAPVRFRDVLLGKNLFLGAVSFVEAFLIWVVVSWIFTPPPPAIVAATFAALLYASLANFAVGNILSVCYPRRLEFGVFRQKRQAGVTLAVAFAAQAVLIGLGAMVFALTRFLDRPALAVFIFLALAVLTGIGYRISFGRIDSIAMNHRETLTAELCRQE
jgi:ABC-2 type transport system permease protein